MTAAELLRSLDERATKGPWGTSHRDKSSEVNGEYGGPVLYTYIGDEREANATLIATTRNLLPELAALVEAVEGFKCAIESEADELPHFNAMWAALSALNARAGREGGG